MKKWAVLILLSMSMFIIVIDTTIMNVSISALVEDLNTTVGGVQAAISIYALVMASFMLIGGKLADIAGKKRVFLIGLVIFGLGTSIASFSQSLLMLIFGWSLLEGLGSALMMPNIQILLRDEYDGAERAFAYGIISAVGAVGAALGPILGGYLTTYHSWRWAFRLEVLIVVLVLVFSGAIAAGAMPAKRPKFDFVGAVLSILGWSTIVLGILLGQQYGFWLAKKPLVLGSLEIAPFGLSVTPVLVGVGVLLVMMLLRWERRQEESGGDGLFKPSLLRTPSLPSGIAVRFVQMAIMAAFLFTGPLLMQLTFEFTAMQTGVALLPFSLALLVAAIVGARLSARFSAKRIIQAGLVIATAGLVVLEVTVQPDISASDLATGALFGAGIGLVASQILNLILSSVEAKDTAETTGINGTFEQLGNAMGVALVGAMMLGSLSGGLQQAINASTAFTPQEKPVLIAAAEESVQLVSNSQLEETLANSGLSEAEQSELLAIYADVRTQAFKSGIAFLIFTTLVGLMLTAGLSDRKLVSAEEPAATSA